MTLAKDISRDDCIEATGKPDATTGYVRKSVGNRIYYAHRLAFAAQYGDIPEGMQIHHMCRNKLCINTKHLRLVTPKEHSKEHGLNGIAKIHADKQECKRGHPLDGKNKKQRYCLECHRQSNKRWITKNPDYFKTYERTIR